MNPGVRYNLPPPSLLYHIHRFCAKRTVCCARKGPPRRTWEPGTTDKPFSPSKLPFLTPAHKRLTPGRVAEAFPSELAGGALTLRLHSILQVLSSFSRFSSHGKSFSCPMLAVVCKLTLSIFLSLSLVYFFKAIFFQSSFEPPEMGGVNSPPLGRW